MTPERVQRKRTKGWKMPPNTIYVGRPSRFGNRFVIDTSDTGRLAHYADYKKNVDLWSNWPLKDAETAVRAFREMQATRVWFLEMVRDLRGKNLACWCALDQPCHADVLLELANQR